MPKRLPLLVWPVLIVAIILVARFDKDHDASGQSYDIKCAQPSDPSSAAASLSCTVNPVQNTGQSEKEPMWWHKLLTWPEGITAWLILATLATIVWQSWETRKSAEAANRGIEVTKTKERAKLLLSLHPLNPMVGHIPEAQFKITNVGESSAIIGMAAAGLHLSHSDVLEGPGDGWYQLKASESVLEAGDHAEETTWWPGHHFIRYEQPVLDGGDIVHLHGIIVYRDAFDDWWQLKFHYIWRTYGGEVWMPHLSANVVGEWENKNTQGEHRLEPPPPRWQFWKRPKNPN